MKALVLILAAAVSCGALAATDVSGNQSGLWTLANSPYNVIGDVTVPVGNNLTIEPGVQIRAMGNFRITVAGALFAIGTETDSIRFLNGQTDPNALWKGIRLENSTDVSTISHCYIENGEYGVNSMNSPGTIEFSRFNKNQKGIQLYGIGSANPATVSVNLNIIERSIQNGILVVENSHAVIQFNELRLNGTGTQYMAAIQLSNQSTGGSNSPSIQYNYIHHNFKQGITAWDIVGANAIQPDIGFNMVEFNLTGIYLLNSSGYVHDNYIRYNFIAGDANSGAGVMVAGATSQPYFERNDIHHNFTGFYIGTNAQPCLGDLSSNNAWAQGENHIYENIDESNLAHSVYTYSYTNPNIVIKAENNYWGTGDPLQIAIGINDHNDDPALPTVDFEPFLTATLDVTVIGQIQYGGLFIVENPRLQFVDAATGEILYEYPVTLGQDFSFTQPLADLFYVVALVDVPATGCTLYGTAGSLLLPIAVAPGDFAPVDVGTIAIEETPPPRHQTAGAPETIGAHNVFPIYNRLFVYHWEYINWLYQEGDFLFLKRHTRYNDAQNIVFDLPDGTPWDKIANLNHNDTWSRVEIMDDSGTQRVSNFVCKAVTDEPPVPDPGSLRMDYFLVLQRDSVTDSLICARMLASDVRRLYHYQNGFVYRAEDIDTNAGENYLQEGNYWDYFPGAPVLSPTYLCMDFNEHYSGAGNRLTLFWQGPADDGYYNWTSYKIYNYDQPFAEVPFGQNFWHTEDLPSGVFLFTVAASDGSNVTGLTNSLFLVSVANSDETAISPVLNVFPNPARSSSCSGPEIRIRSAKALSGILSLSNLRGQTVKSVPIASPGDFSYRWDQRDASGRSCASGIYLLKIELRGAPAQTRKIVLLN